MENAPRNDASAREQGSCSRAVATMTIAAYLLLAMGLSLLAGCATAGTTKVESADSGIDASPVRLAKFAPARYDKPEVHRESVASRFEIERPASSAAPVIKGEAPAAAPSSAATVEQGEDAARAAKGNEHGTDAKE